MEIDGSVYSLTHQDPEVAAAALRGTGSTRLPRARPSTGPARPGPAGLGVGQGSKRTREGSLQQPFLRLSPLAPAASQSCVNELSPMGNLGHKTYRPGSAD